MYGRAQTYHAAIALFCALSFICAASSDLNLLIAFRCFRGVIVASLVNHWKYIQRGGAMSFLTIASLLEPVLGLVFGG